MADDPFGALDLPRSATSAQVKEKYRALGAPAVPTRPALPACVDRSPAHAARSKAAPPRRERGECHGCGAVQTIDWRVHTSPRRERAARTRQARRKAWQAGFGATRSSGSLGHQEREASRPSAVQCSRVGARALRDAPNSSGDGVGLAGISPVRVRAAPAQAGPPRKACECRRGHCECSGEEGAAASASVRLARRLCGSDYWGVGTGFRDQRWTLVSKVNACMPRRLRGLQRRRRRRRGAQRHQCVGRDRTCQPESQTGLRHHCQSI